MSKSNCIFCNIIKNQTYKLVFKNDNFVAFLDIFPKNLGHTVVVPKRHSKNFMELQNNELKEVNLIIKKIIKAMEKSLNIDGFNILVNTGKNANQVIFHTHFHIIPTYKNKEIKPEVSDEIANKIKMEIK